MADLQAALDSQSLGALLPAALRPLLEAAVSEATAKAAHRQGGPTGRKAR